MQVAHHVEMAEGEASPMWDFQGFLRLTTVGYRAAKGEVDSRPAHQWFTIPWPESDLPDSRFWGSISMKITVSMVVWMMGIADSSIPK